jgi:hypothetical protein
MFAFSRHDVGEEECVFACVAGNREFRDSCGVSPCVCLSQRSVSRVINWLLLVSSALVGPQRATTEPFVPSSDYTWVPLGCG